MIRRKAAKRLRMALDRRCVCPQLGPKLAADMARPFTWQENLFAVGSCALNSEGCWNFIGHQVVLIGLLHLLPPIQEGASGHKHAKGFKDRSVQICCLVRLLCSSPTFLLYL